MFRQMASASGIEKVPAYIMEGNGFKDGADFV